MGSSECGVDGNGRGRTSELRIPSSALDHGVRTGDDMRALADLVATHEDWLMHRALQYAKERGYAQYTSTLAEAWRIAIAGLSESLLAALDHYEQAPELGPDDDYAGDPIAYFGVVEAQRHRARGVTLGMFLGLMKYYRQSYVDLVLQAGLEPEDEERFRLFINRFFDRVEVGFCVEWAALGENEKTEELQSTNRAITNEKNRYLTIFESLQDPVVLLDRENRVENANHAAAEMFESLAVPGAGYYGQTPAEQVVSWLADELATLCAHDAPELSVGKELEAADGARHFDVKLKRLLDVSERLVGTVVMLSDVTEREQMERWLLQANDQLEDRVAARTAELVKAAEDLRMEVVQRKRAEESVRSITRQIEFVLGATKTGLDIIDSDFGIRYIDAEWQKAHGDPAGRKCHEYFMGRREPCPECGVVQARETGVPAVTERLLVKDGHRPVQVTTIPFQTDGGERLFAQVKADITERKRAEQERQALLRLHESTADTMPSSLLVLDAGLTVLMANRRYLAARGIEAADVVGKNIAKVFPASLLSKHSLLERMQAIAENGGQEELLGVMHRSGDHGEKYLNIHVCGIRSPGQRTGEPRVLLVIDDVTQRTVLEQQMHQRAKLESVGTLAGGVAHDFNNLLTGIMGYEQLARGRIGADHPASRYVGQIRGLADRAAGLTRQLLAFSRKQPLEPIVLNINELIEGTTKMLRRLIGEDLELEFTPGEALGNVRADPGQLEQVLMNLAVNARDAMPTGGKLTVETADVTLDHEYVARRFGVLAGPYVMLAVSDTGCGMDPATRERIFEPFFTTKEVGKGTGLGLSTVYGIVKQHGGNIWVYSEPGQGTTFKIYLPRVDAKEDRRTVAAKKPSAPRGADTILVAEDDRAVRSLMEEALRDLGYTVISAGSPVEAEQMFAQHNTEVELLLTDVIMPEQSGRELYERLAAACPSLKVLYTSGYTDNAIVHHGVLDPGTPFIPKPFDVDALARKVREVLDGEGTDER